MKAARRIAALEGGLIRDLASALRLSPVADNYKGSGEAAGRGSGLRDQPPAIAANCGVRPALSGAGGQLFCRSAGDRVPKGNSAALDAVNRFLDEAKASGLIDDAIRRAGLVSTADTAPPRAK